MGSTDALLFPCPNYFFKSPGLDQEGSAYGDETVRYFKFQKWNIKSERKKEGWNMMTCDSVWFVFGGFLNIFTDLKALKD